MRRFSLIFTAALLAFSCGGNDIHSHQTRDWTRVLESKRTALAPGATAREKQLYADALSAFVHEHPQHGRARAVYRRIQLDFGYELSSLGRYRDATRFYRAVLASDPANVEASKGLAYALDRLSIGRARLLMLEKGMTRKQVAELLGKPLPGWQIVKDRPESTIESWYYRTTEGGIAGVYFKDGEVIAAEAASHAKLAPLTH